MATRSSTTKKVTRTTTTRSKQTLAADEVAVNITKKTSKRSTKSTTKKKPRSKTAATIKAAATAGRSRAKKLPTTKDGTANNPLGHLLVSKLYREAGFRGGISAKDDLLEAYSTDESIFSIRPQVILQPKNRRDVEIAARVTAEHVEQFPSLSLTPRAAGTGLGGGSLTDSVVIDVCAHMQKIGDITEKKGQYSLQCEPGAMLRDVEKKLKKEGLYIPAYPASKDICSIGGCVANNAAGADTLRYGHTAEWVESMDVVLADGHTYTIKPLSYREFSLLIKQDHEHARIAKAVFDLIKKNEKAIKHGRPHTKKNSAGYALWDVLPEGVSKFKKGTGVFNLTRLFSGSQGTIGIVVHLTMRAIPVPQNTTLLAIPIFDLDDAAKSIVTVLDYNPINVEIFDALSFDLALKNPSFFKDRLSSSQYYRTMLNMYTTYHVRFRRRIPEFTVLVTLDEDTMAELDERELIDSLATKTVKPRLVKNPIEQEMFWQIRRASYTLSKFQDETKRPAAFLEDMTVPPENLAKFFKDIKKLLKEFNTSAAVHGHGGNGHFHFYPLLDFTDSKTPDLVEKMADRFFKTAVKYDGNLCGEHNDGIIRTPHLSKMFTKGMIELFEQTEALFDPNDIFNPGKKVNPRFDIKETMRKTN